MSSGKEMIVVMATTNNLPGGEAECRPLEELIKTVLAFLFFLAVLMLNAMLIVIVHERVPLEINPLPDIVFDLLPYWFEGIKLAENYMTILFVAVMLLCFFHRKGHRIAQRFFIINGIVYFLRAICFSVTQLPPPTNRFDCTPKVSNNLSVANYINVISRRTVINIFTGGMESLTKTHYCGDIIFSGHTTNIVISYSFVSYYLMPLNSRKYYYLWVLTDLILFLLSFGSVVLILVARFHYLVDVVFAYYISTRVFYIYHTLCAFPALHVETRNNFFVKFWWWPLFTFFEGHTDTNVAAKGFHNPFRALSNFITNRTTSPSASAPAPRATSSPLVVVVDKNV